VEVQGENIHREGEEDGEASDEGFEARHFPWWCPAYKGIQQKEVNKLKGW
jgi:hypothetical protein